MRVRRVEGPGIAVRGDDIDTDQIMPPRFLKWITFRGLEAHVFEDARRAAREAGRAHPFDRPEATGARVLLVNRNFGCGSSREHAPQGLHRRGVAAVVGESFGEIFAGNCVAIGVPCVEVGADAAAALQDLAEEAPSTAFALDLDAMRITAGDLAYPVRLREGRRRQLLDGTWDSTAVLLSAARDVDAVLDAP